MKDAQLKKALDDAYAIVNGNYVIPGIVQKIINAENCASENEEIRVDLFTDPYCEACIKIKENMSNLRVQFGYDYEKLKFYYNYLPTASNGLFLQEGKERTELFARTLLCAAYEGRGKLPMVEHELYGIYCDMNDNEKLEIGELQNCRRSEHWGETLSEGEVDLAVMNSGFDQAKFDDCRNSEEIEQEITSYAEKAEMLGIRETPMMAINCEYITYIVSSDELLCAYDPTLEGCATE